jgi:hypothetical protein
MLLQSLSKVLQPSLGLAEAKAREELLYGGVRVQDEEGW